MADDDGKSEQIYEEWLKRMVPASNDEIIRLAEKMWADPNLCRVFQRVGYDGDMTDAEENAVNEAIDSYRRGPLWDRDELHLALAPCLVRQRASRRLNDFEDQRAIAFLEDRKVKRAGPLIKVIPANSAEVIAFANQIYNNSHIWSIFNKPGKNDSITEKEQLKINEFAVNYEKKYGLFNRSGSSFSVAYELLRQLAYGNLTDINSPNAWQIVNASPFVSK